VEKTRRKEEEEKCKKKDEVLEEEECRPLQANSLSVTGFECLPSSLS
jgi:hypothetical protein